MAKLYAGLHVPSIFFYGVRTGGMSKRSRAFLKAHGCETEEFATAAHWPMTEAPGEFMTALVRGVQALHLVTRAQERGTTLDARDSRAQERGTT